MMLPWIMTLLTVAGQESQSLASEAQALLASRCISCHGPDKQSGGLRLDSAMGVSRGGDSGTSVASGQPDASGLIRAIRSNDPKVQMPPKNKLSEREIGVLVRWVKNGARWPMSAAVALFDEDAQFAALLTSGNGTARVVSEAPYSGKVALAITPLQRESPRIPGWEYLIREKPVDGQFRYLRMAWRKKGAGGIMLELARSGQWPDAQSPLGRYHAGPNTTGWASKSVANTAPAFWTTVTVDLWKDLGDTTITGLAPTCDGGSEACFDAIILGPTIESLDAYKSAGPVTVVSKPVGNAFTDTRNPIRTLFGGDRLDLWSLKLPVAAIPPAGAAHPIDGFINKHLAESKIAPWPKADKRTLIRRLTADLTGLPPTPAEVDAFLADQRPEAYLLLVDRLLASPRYGERQARLWLDVVRYADTNGYERDEYRPLAWRYRDYVIRSFNADKPFELFVREQIAGDEMAPNPPQTPADTDALIATGYLRLGQWDSTAGIFQEEKRLRAEQMADLTNTTASAFLGITMSCCQCHDHKYDPLSHVDHFRLRAFFAGVTPHDDTVIDVAARQQEFKQHHAQIDASITPLKAALEKLPKEDAKGRSDLRAKINALDAKKRQPERAMTASDAGETAPATHRLDQGAHDAPREEVAPGFVSVLHPEEAKITRPRPGTTGRRLTLAGWIVARDNPWTARVAVNRLWQQHFATGIVATPNDFGISGARPTHPELLDWLATTFIEKKWSIKAMHRLMVTSEAYQRQSSSSGPAPANDPANRLLWRQNPQRLDAETIRDSLLMVSGLLKERQGGKPVWPRIPEELLKAQPAILEAEKGGDGGRMQGWYPDPDELIDVRSVYLIRKRCLPIPFLQAFDLPDTTVSCARRDTTVVAPQALILLNSPDAVRFATALAARALKSGTNHAERIRFIFRTAFSREPDAGELNMAGNWLQERSREGDAAWVQFCRAILNTNEFVHID